MMIRLMLYGHIPCVTTGEGCTITPINNTSKVITNSTTASLISSYMQYCTAEGVYVVIQCGGNTEQTAC